MEDKDIIKALECCANGDGCEDCPRSRICDGIEHIQNALDLINRQKADIERLNREIQITKDAYTMLQTKLDIIKNEMLGETEVKDNE